MRQLGAISAYPNDDAALRLTDAYSTGRLIGSHRALLVASMDAPRLPDGRRRLLPAGERGELLLNAQMSLGGGAMRYLGNDEATLALRSEYDGFYNTGDYGYYAESGQCCATVVLFNTICTTLH